MNQPTDSRKPTTWITLVLAFFVPPLGMLYLGRPAFALLYFLASTTIGVVDFWAQFNRPDIAFYTAFAGLPLMLLCTAHAYGILTQWQDKTVRRWYSRAYGLWGIAIAILLGIFLFRSFAYEPFKMPSSSMSPTLNTGDVIVVAKWGYGKYGTFGITLYDSEPILEFQRGDLIVFEYPKDPSSVFVKRVIGLPGDRVEFSNHGLRVNGVQVARTRTGSSGHFEIYSERLDDTEFSIQSITNARHVASSVTVPPGHLFVMGDNRDNSNDSRFWGFLPLHKTIGKVVYVFRVKRD